MRVLVVNAGSSSLKLALIGDRDETLAERELPAVDGGDVSGLREALEGSLASADVAGHRIVHGGERFRNAIAIDRSVRTALEELVDLAPLHQPKSLAALDAVTEALPEVRAVACFDTAFHATLSPAAATYAIPASWRARWRIRRYGFHGLSHAWVARRVPQLLRRSSAGLRIVSCHLGAGASLCAIKDGRSVDTTMGFTPLEGLVMATRSGTVDPGLLLWLLERTGMSERELAAALEHDSGLSALAGTPDMRAVLDRVAAGDGDAVLALDVYTHRLKAAIGAMAATLDGLDALVFTGGVGEHAPEIRARVASGLSFLGIELDSARNGDAELDATVNSSASAVSVLVVRSREDLEIARQVRALG